MSEWFKSGFGMVVCWFYGGLGGYVTFLSGFVVSKWLCSGSSVV